MFKKILLFTCLFFAVLTGYSQIVTECPQNVGFENGTFTNWQCYTGVVGGTTNPQIPLGVVSVSPSGPTYNRHELIKRGSATDPYGGFSLNAPNGSDYVVKLGNDNNGAEAESISYTLTVPSNVDTYSIIFSYAVVFQNPFSHRHDEQPKFTAKVFDVTTNSSTSCGSFEFVAPGLNGGLPGFLVSPIPGVSNSNVLYKPWSPILVNLSDYLGHTIRLEFTTNDCTFRQHFGYAYIDFNENCSIPITGNVTCPDADAITLRVLPGFYQYNWYNANSELLGTADSLVLSPTPPAGTKISVELVPYDGLGCTQTLSTVITGIDMHIQNPLPNCAAKGVDITDISLKVGNSSDLTYTYWNDDKAKNPISNPKHITTSGIYYVKGLSSSGCFIIKPVTVIITHLPSIVVTQPDPVNYPNTVDITRTFVHQPGLTYSYWADQDTTIRVKNPTVIRLGGTFYIKAIDVGDCETTAPVIVDVVLPDMVIPNTFTPNGDGVNDVFTVLVNSHIKIKSFKIFNRWGQTVFVTSDITHFWDGFKENTMMPAGVYYWVLEGDDNSQKRFLRSGYVTVLR